MTIVIHGAAVATVDADDTVFYDGAVAVEADRIVAVGPTREVLARYPQAERIDGEGKAVMPGFANVHTHLYMTLARGIYEDLSPPHKPPFTSGLSPLPLPPLDPDEHRVFCLLGVLEAIRSGTTAILEDATGIEAYVEDLAATGARFLLTERAWDKAKGSIGDPSPFEVDRKLGFLPASRPCTTGVTAWPMAASAWASPPGRRTCARLSFSATCAPCRKGSILSRPSTSTRSGARLRP